MPVSLNTMGITNGNHVLSASSQWVASIHVCAALLRECVLKIPALRTAFLPFVSASAGSQKCQFIVGSRGTSILKRREDYAGVDRLVIFGVAGSWPACQT